MLLRKRLLHTIDEISESFQVTSEKQVSKAGHYKNLHYKLQITNSTIIIRYTFNDNVNTNIAIRFE